MPGQYCLCLFGDFVSGRHEPSKKVLMEVRAASASERDVIFIFVDAKTEQRLITRSVKTTTPIQALPKLLMFAPSGEAIGFFPSDEPKARNNIIQFCRSFAKKRSYPSGGGGGGGRGSRGPSRGPNYGGDDYYQDESDEDDYEEPKRRGRNYEGDMAKMGIKSLRRKSNRNLEGDTEDFLIPPDVLPHNSPWTKEV